MCCSLSVTLVYSVRGGGRFQEIRCDYREQKVTELLIERRDERQGGKKDENMSRHEEEDKEGWRRTEEREVE